MKHKQKIAVIVSGGGIKCSYNAGALVALAKEHKISEPDILICCSGSAGSGAYYLTKQYGDIKNIWVKQVSRKRFLNKARFWKIIDIDFLNE